MTTTVYSPSSDGDISSAFPTYATARSGIGATKTAHTTDTTAPVGQAFSAGTYTLYQTFLAFDTTAIYGQSVSSVTLALYGDTDSSTTDFSVEAYQYNWDRGTGLINIDWLPGANVSSFPLLATGPSTSAFAVGYYDLTSTAAFLSVPSSGTTEIVLVSTRFTANTSRLETSSCRTTPWTMLAHKPPS